MGEHNKMASDDFSNISVCQFPRFDRKEYKKSYELNGRLESKLFRVRC